MEGEVVALDAAVNKATAEAKEVLAVMAVAMMVMVAAVRRIRNFAPRPCSLHAHSQREAHTSLILQCRGSRMLSRMTYGFAYGNTTVDGATSEGL